MDRKLVIIPTYNEIENVADMIEEVMGLESGFDLLIVDDSSPDGTGDVVKEKRNQYPESLFLMERDGKSGLGTAYIAGFKWALDKGYDYIFEMDCDFSHNPKDLERLYRVCSDEGYDMAVGSRYVNHLVNVVNWPMGRVLLSYFASMYVRMITRLKIMDTTAGFICYKARVLQTIDLDKIRFRGYAFQIEMKFTASKHGFRLAEIPIIFTDRSRGTSKMTKGIVREAFLGVIQLKFSSFFRKYREPVAS